MQPLIESVWGGNSLFRSLVALRKTVKERMSNGIVQSDSLRHIVFQHLLEEVEQLLVGQASGVHIALFGGEKGKNIITIVLTINNMLLLCCMTNDGLKTEAYC